MRVRTNYMTMHKRRTLARAAMRRGCLDRRITCDRIGAIDLGKIEVREVGHQLRDVSAGCVHLHRHRDGVSVVLADKKYRQLQVRSAVHRLPELALARGSI